MILVDSSVWVDYFRGVVSPQTDRLDKLIETDLLVTGDIVLTEVLQGFASDRHFRQALRLLTSMDVITIGGRDIAAKAAQNFRTLRAKGITVRKTIDTLIATRCIEAGYALLFSDRDFDPFVDHLGMASAMVDRGAVRG